VEGTQHEPHYTATLPMGLLVEAAAMLTQGGGGAGEITQQTQQQGAVIGAAQQIYALQKHQRSELESLTTRSQKSGSGTGPWTCPSQGPLGQGTSVSTK